MSLGTKKHDSSRFDFKVQNQTVLFRSSEDLSPLYGEDIDLVLTSPPYWNLKKYGHENELGRKGETYDEYIQRMVDVFSECFKVTSDNAILAINLMSIRHKKKFYPIALDLYNRMKEDSGCEWKLLDDITWYCPNSNTLNSYYYDKWMDNKKENILVFGKNYDFSHDFTKIRVLQKWAELDPREDNKNPDGRCIGNVVRIPAYKTPKIKKKNYHQAAFPPKIPQLFIHWFSKEGGKVLDPFLGSGTTLMVAEKLGRIGFGIEINAANSDLIKKRINEDWEPSPWEEFDIIHSSYIPQKKE